MSLDKIQVLYNLFKIWLKAKYTKVFQAFEYLKLERSLRKSRIKALQGKGYREMWHEFTFISAQCHIH